MYDFQVLQVNVGFVDLHATSPVLQKARLPVLLLNSRVPIGRTLIVPTGLQRLYDPVDSKAENMVLPGSTLRQGFVPCKKFSQKFFVILPQSFGECYHFRNILQRGICIYFFSVLMRQLVQQKELSCGLTELLQF